MPKPTKPWFAPKAFGYGASLPIAWQGWIALLGFLGGMACAGAFLQGWPRAIAMAALVVAFAATAYLKTDGGWRWRGMR